MRFLDEEYSKMQQQSKLRHPHDRNLRFYSESIHFRQIKWGNFWPRSFHILTPICDIKNKDTNFNVFVDFLSTISR